MEISSLHGVIKIKQNAVGSEGYFSSSVFNLCGKLI